MKKDLLLYNAGGCLTLGEIMQRKMEQEKIDEIGFPVFNPINAEHNDKQKNKNDEGLAERIVRNDTEQILNATHVMIEPLPQSLGTHVELGQIYQHNLIMNMLAELHEVSKTDEEFATKVLELMKKYPKKKVFPHYQDIRTHDVPQVWPRKDIGLNAYVYGITLGLTENKGLYTYDEIWNELKKELNK